MQRSPEQACTHHHVIMGSTKHQALTLPEVLQSEWISPLGFYQQT